MHILVLNFEYPPLGGGASPVCHEINSRYAQAGHQVSVVTMGFKNLPAHEIISGVTIYRVPCLRRHIHICQPYEQASYLLAAKRFLKQWLKHNTIDICHAHFVLPTGILTSWLHRRYKIPCIITSHGSDIPGFNPDRFTFLHHFTPPLIRQITASVFAITSPSLYLAGLIQNVIPGQKEKIRVIPNGINSHHFKPGEKIMSVVSSGRLLPRKGFRELVHAVKELDIPAGVHILGDGPLRYELELDAKESKSAIIFHGWMDHRQPVYKEMLGSAAIYCLVSSRENASIAILEAMASGCAIITADDSGCPEMVADTGLLVSPGQPHAIAEAISTLIQSPDKLKALGLLARTRAVDVYDWDRITSQYLELLHDARLGSSTPNTFTRT